MTTKTAAATKDRSTSGATGAPRAGTGSKSRSRAAGRRGSGEVEKAVLSDLKGLPAEMSKSGLAALALTLAREVDSPGNSATSKSMCARVLFDALERLRELAPVEEKADGLDDLVARRAARLAGVAGS